MAKAGLRRPDPEEPHGTESNHKANFPRNDVPAVPQIQGKAKHGKGKARPIIAGTQSPSMKVYHGTLHSDNPIAESRLENDSPEADL
ncbi:MAG TPA: hypothetical protein PLD83_06050 [Oscillospiraceae bacterium]|nr:hypothetical protein [Oscillospiraceae bacterium]HPS75983.1 hypothetical protein [Oscillospiraceae bacterium]